MRKTIAVLIAVITAGLWFVPRAAQSQEGPKENSPGPARVKPVDPYRLDFSFNELEDGKKVNTRHYSMNLTANESNEIKIGTRVPVASASSAPGSTLRDTQYQYLDVGTNIWAQLRAQGDEWVLVVRGDVSNLDVETGDHGAMLPPVVRQIKISGSTLLVAGKPILIGSADDPNSKRQFQLEVTVTRLR